MSYKSVRAMAWGGKIYVQMVPSCEMKDRPEKIKAKIVKLFGETAG